MPSGSVCRALGNPGEGDRSRKGKFSLQLVNASDRFISKLVKRFKKIDGSYQQLRKGARGIMRCVGRRAKHIL